MKRKISVILGAVIICQLATAQVTELEKKVRDNSSIINATDSTKYWKKGGVISVNLAQSSFTNWTAGGENSVAVNSLLSVFANYKKGNASWDNMLDLGYGFLNQTSGSGYMKTDDKIDFSTKYGQAASKHWYYAALLNFKSQMTPAYNYPNDSTMVSRFFAPAYVIAAIGMDYKPSANFTAFIAPLTGKTTIVNDKSLSNAGAFGVEPGEMIRSEFGGYVRMVYSRDLMKKSVSVLSKLDLFTNYMQNPENIDVNWENVIGLKVNKYISATVTTQLIYDDDVIIEIDKNGDGIIEKKGPRIQFKEVIGVGFTYKF